VGELTLAHGHGLELELQAIAFGLIWSRGTHGTDSPLGRSVHKSQARFLSARVRLLFWVARINMIGLALTALEIGYMICKDDDLQNWLERCVFRREKQTNNLLGGKSNTEHFGNIESELKALAQIYNSVEPH